MEKIVCMCLHTNTHICTHTRHTYKNIFYCTIIYLPTYCVKMQNRIEPFLLIRKSD